MLLLHIRKFIPIAATLSALIGLFGCAPMSAQSGSAEKISDIDKIRGILNSGKSIVFVPNTDSPYSWGRMEAQNKSFAVGRRTFYEDLNKTTGEIEVANVSLAGQFLSRGVMAPTSLLQTKMARLPNPHRLEATGADFAFVAARPGATLFIQKIGALDVPPEGVGNRKLPNQVKIGTIEFEPTLPKLEYGSDKVYKDDAWQTRNETTGYMCNGYGHCTPIQEQVSRRTRQAGYYDVPTAKWGKQGLGAKAHLDAANSAVYLQVPEAGQIYVTDALLFSIADSFAWGDQNCVQKPVDNAHVYAYRECPLMGVSYVKYDASTTILRQLKTQLTKGGWPEELVQRIKYLPLTKFRLSAAEYKAAINAPNLDQSTSAAASEPAPAPAPAPAGEDFLAFSLSKKERHFGGGAGKTEAIAKSQAQLKCGKADCEVVTVTSTSNNSCIAAAWGRKSNGDNYDFSTQGKSESEAKQAALKNCQANAGNECQVYYAQCLPSK